MSDNQITWEINVPEEDTTGSVNVTFTCATTEIVYTRSINTSDCVDDAAVQARISEVAAGVHNKISVGAITASAEETAEDSA